MILSEGPPKRKNINLVKNNNIHKNCSCKVVKESEQK